MHGMRRVVTFCLLTTVVPSILIILPLYLHNIKYANVMYKISDSQVIQIHRGQSSVFCEKHSLTMNSTFNAFQMKGRPKQSDKRKHIKLKKSMLLPDDTLEYWGFYLLKGSTVTFKACSRYEGSKILVVKGNEVLNTCGILEGNNNKKDPGLATDEGRVHVTVETPDTGVKSLSDDITKLVLNNMKNDDLLKRNARSTSLHKPNTIIDAGVNHGGNAFNDTQDSSVSSFEIKLHECYNGNILKNQFFPYSISCNGTDYLESTTILKLVHEVDVDGYYYYIFYSDNDIVNNDVHVIFDIYKPTFQYADMSDKKVCINKTMCMFDIGFLSDELVIVEVPTKDGMNSDHTDDSVLVSVCHPRVAVYVIFPIAVLLLILLFAFL